MKTLISALALILMTNTVVFGQCANGKCQNTRTSVRVVVSEPVRKVAQVPANLVQSVGQVPANLVQRVVQPKPIVHVQVNQQVQPVQLQPVQLRTGIAYDTSSFHSNGSGITLADHLRTTHGINPTGMSVAQQDAAHLAAHNRSTSVKVFRTRLLRFR